MQGGTKKCPICGRPYKWYTMTVADQSACPTCVAEADRRERAPTEDEEQRYARARREFWR